MRGGGRGERTFSHHVVARSTISNLLRTINTARQARFRGRSSKQTTQAKNATKFSSPVHFATPKSRWGLRSLGQELSSYLQHAITAAASGALSLRIPPFSPLPLPCAHSSRPYKIKTALPQTSISLLLPKIGKPIAGSTAGCVREALAHHTRTPPLRPHPVSFKSSREQTEDNVFIVTSLNTITLKRLSAKHPGSGVTLENKVNGSPDLDRYHGNRSDETHEGRRELLRSFVVAFGRARAPNEVRPPNRVCLKCRLCSMRGRSTEPAGT